MNFKDFIDLMVFTKNKILCKFSIAGRFLLVISAISIRDRQMQFNRGLR